MFQVCLDAHVAHHVCMGPINYDEISRATDECMQEDINSMLAYESQVIKADQQAAEEASQAEEEGEVVASRMVEGLDMADQDFNFIDFVMGYVMQKFCIYKVSSKKKSIN